MTAVKISIAIALFLDLIWTIFWLLQIGLDGRQMNRRIKDADHPSPDELRNRAVMVGQLALMGMVNVMAGALAGIGSSLFVDEGRVRWPSSQAPYALIILAVSLTVFSGIIIAAYITRPARKWVWDTSDFRSYLRQIKREGVVSETELVEIRERRERWERHTNVRPLRNPEELRALGSSCRKRVRSGFHLLRMIRLNLVSCCVMTSPISRYGSGFGAGDCGNLGYLHS